MNQPVPLESRLSPTVAYAHVALRITRPRKAGLERPCTIHPLFNRFAPAERTPRRCSPGAGRPCFAGLQVDLRELTLSFSVATDEEYVGLRLVADRLEMDMGERRHNYLLLTLARRRLADRVAGLPEPACGWVYVEDWARDPSLAPPKLNIDILRIRRQFAFGGVLDAARIIERRRSTRQLRIGTGRIAIVPV
jgi:hypothetical protein